MADQQPQPRDRNNDGMIDALRDELRKRNPNLPADPRHRPSTHSAEKVETMWQRAEQQPQAPMKRAKRKISFARKILIFSFLFFVATVLIAFFSFYRENSSVSTDNIALELEGKAFIDGGDTYDLEVSVINGNPAPLQSAQLVVTYPRGTFDGLTDRKVVELGEIGVNQSVDETVSFQLFGREGSEHPVNVRFEYLVQGSNATFFTEDVHTVVARSTPVTFTLQAPEELVPEQEFLLEMAAEQMTGTTENAMIKADYPPGFVFVSAVPEPSLSNNIWHFRELELGDTLDIAVRGYIRAEQGEEKTFRASVGIRDDINEKKIGTLLNTAQATVGASSPFMNVFVELNGDRDVATIDDDDDISGTISWRNTSGETLTNLKIVAELSGNVLPQRDVEARTANYRQAEQTLTWARDTLSTLGSIAAGDSGEVDFAIEVPRGGLTSVTNPQFNVAVNIEAVDESGDFLQVDDIATAEARVNSNMGLVSETRYETGVFQNSGPIPPKVGLPTAFTLTWSLTSSVNDLSDVEVRTTLPDYVNWLGQIVPTTENVEYNAVTRSVRWRVGTVAAGTGYDSPAKQLHFQVMATPTTSHAERFMPLTDGTRFSGEDAFTGERISERRGDHNSRLVDDNTGAAGVVEN